MNWNDIPSSQPTPSLVVSAEIVRRNIRQMQDYCDANSLKLRPHTKTHKSIWMANEQIVAGASGLTVAKAGEAEIMASASDDLMIAYPAVGPARLRRVTDLARTCQIRIGVDSQPAIEILQSAAAASNVKLGLIVDVDVGFHRTGVMDADRAVELCLFASKQANLEFLGLMCFPGHLSAASPDSLWENYTTTLASIVERLHQHGIAVDTVSGGSTPTAKLSHRNPILNEIRPGTYIYNDVNEVGLGVATWEDCAARVLATIVSVPERNKFVVDAGSKTLSSDRYAVNPDAGFGKVLEYPNGKVTRLSEEHGEVVFTDEDLAQGRAPKVGDRVWIIPNHICVCVNLQNQFYLMDGKELVEMQVDARGLLV